MSLYKFLVTGYRPSLSIFSFEPATAKIKLVSESSPAPQKATWIELADPNSVPSQGPARYLYSLSDANKGSAVSLKLVDDHIEITGQRVSHGGGVHIHIMKDGSGIVVSNFNGGSIIFFPVTSSGVLSETSESPLLTLPFVYESQTAPNVKRQEASHAHHVVEGRNGTLYVSDLGNDRIWIVKREGESGLAIHGYLQAPPGTGPRHSLISKNEKYLYCLTELTNEILVFPLENTSEPIQSLPDFKCSIIPPSVPPAAHHHLNAAELIFNPTIPNVLYASNRLELSLPAEFATGEPGDAVAVVTLNEEGNELVDLKSIRTGCDGIRGMRASPDGKYVAVAGRYGGGVEIWSVGDSGVDWRLAGKDEHIDLVTDIAWL
ncbi:hypothetical protein LQV05_006563 [Cryptococcus neoformans]|nr:hypothetical protein J007_01899 [Cryptococcus neoformans var. grubii]OXC62704.1 hypothetical protein C358_01944 [Cryptococcus neoformans var. grubii MW-RSA852]UOH83825.1 hypothetical protein LQV05_006563 [Cryptococcus neoformans]